MTRPRRRSLAAVMAVVFAFLGYSGIGERGESPAVEGQPAGVTLKGTSHSGGKDKSPSKGSTAKGNRQTVDGGHLPPAKDISFKAPIDFATGAIPSSAAFNVAHGDQMPLFYSRATPLSDWVAVGDFNRDGKSDVAQTNVIAGSVSVFLGDGRGGFKLLVPIPVGEHPIFVTAGDLDLDGDLDLAVANYGSNDLSILRGDGEGKFLPSAPVPVPGPRNVAIGNFNGDDTPDLAVASSGRPALTTPTPHSMGGVAILTGKLAGGSSIFAPTQFIPLTANSPVDGRPVGANYVAVGDFNHSGFDDLAVGVGTSPNAGDQQDGTTQLTGDDVLVFLNHNQPPGTTPEQPFSTSTEQQRFRVGGLPNAIAVEDLNGDTHPDLAAMGSGSGDITTLLGDGQGQFAVKATNVTVGGLPFSLAAGDFNDDGIPDLVTANFSASTVSVLRGNGDGIFQPAVDFWSGDATMSAAVGDFNRDGRLDVVAGRLRDDHLALLLNDSPQRGDGVVIKRDIPYGSLTHPTNDPFAAHHTLDVYTPPLGTASFAGRGRPYPVVLFAHGGFNVTCDKSMVSYLMRSLALEGIVAVSIDYRLGLGPEKSEEDRVKDVAQAFRWTRDNVGSGNYGGDPKNIFVSGTSAGALLVSKLATEAAYSDDQKNIRGLVTLGLAASMPGNTAVLPPSLLLNGDESIEIALTPNSAAFSAESERRGAESDHVIVPGRDHLTLVSDIALPDDLGRVRILDFMRKHLTIR